ncbi:MAG: hypothetical protein DCF25_21095 [Leptolyngbya foveolarum]|uniref:Uncharacterized protein n=1 Tax=Leptolyngbya foveolarum TaxID=47253 RepID=A0A2W4VCZ5_9CYAN|nr:MAG: hypothetical protein DCF25_21095 [Leptolyngbya foveolarum]
MVRASSQIKQELSLLQQRTQELETSLEPLYEGYLKALSEAGGRQLIMAAFHICTQAYPSKFLSLSLQQRNQLQQEIQGLSNGLYRQLIAQREQAKKASRRSPKKNGLAFLQRLLEAKSSGAAIVATDGSRESLLEKLSALGLSGDDDRDGDDWLGDVPAAEEDDDGLDAFAGSAEADGDERDDAQAFEGRYENVDIFESGFEADAGRRERTGLSREGDDALADRQGDDLGGEGDRNNTNASSENRDPDFELEVPPADERLTLTEDDDLLSALEGLARRSAEDEETEPEETLVPIHLVRQQMLLEKAIRKVLEQVSERANECLQKADIMPSFPKALISAASGSREMGEPINSVPNVFKVSVRVMHGEAMMEAVEDALPRGDSDGADRPRRRKQSRESDRRQRARRPRMPREGPRDAVEIDALPELSMISMQLSEVEFSDHTVSAWRSRIRQEFENLKKLGSRYQKTQRALETAQAEDAWRASWTPVRADESGSEESGSESLEQE